MFDCANVEMRELLPELAAGTLDAATRARLEQHIASCAECASELETLRLVRSAYASAPAVDVRRIAAALSKAAPPAPRAASTRKPITRWMDWRVAAALTMITVGGLACRHASVDSRSSLPDSVAVVSHVDTSRQQPTSSRPPGHSFNAGRHEQTRRPGRSHSGRFPESAARVCRRSGRPR